MHFKEYLKKYSLSLGLLYLLSDFITQFLALFLAFMISILEFLAVGEILMSIWTLIFKTRPLNDDEIYFSTLIHGDYNINYKLVRIHNCSPLSLIFKASISSFYIIHFPNDNISLKTLIHELTHTAQYQAHGAIYMPKAIIAQIQYGRVGGHGSKSAYDYEREESLSDQIINNKSFSDLNYEAQAELVEDYFEIKILQGKIPPTEMENFISQMQVGLF